MRLLGERLQALERAIAPIVEKSAGAGAKAGLNG